MNRWWWRLLAFFGYSFRSANPLVDLRRAIVADQPEGVCAKVALRCLRDKRIRAMLVDETLSKKFGRQVLRQAGLHVLVTKDERFDAWRCTDAKHQAAYVRKVVRIRNLLPDHLHEI